MDRSYNQRPETRRAILEAGAKLVKLYGFSKVTMVDIAREAGLGKATLYQYFRDKEHIALEYRLLAENEALEKLDQIRRQTDLSPQERLREMLAARVMLGFDIVQPYIFQLTEVFAALRAAFLAQRQELQKSEAKLFEKILIEGKEKGCFAFDDSYKLAFILITATNSLLPLGLTQSELGSRTEVETRANELAALLVRGVADGAAPLSNQIENSRRIEEC